VKNKLKYLILILFIYNCSIDTNSGFWTKTKKIERDKNVKIKNVFVDKKILEKEFNANIKINIKTKNLENSFLNNISNNNGNINFTGSFEKISKYKFKKIDNFNNLIPELTFTKNSSVIFFDNKGSIIKFDENSSLKWKINTYKKKEIKLNPILSFASNDEFLIVVDNLGKYYAININTGAVIWSKKNTAPFNSQVKILDDKFYVVDYTDTLRCFSIKNGKEIWKSTSETSLIKSLDRVSLVISDNEIVYHNSLGDLVAVNIKTGNLIWQISTQKNLSNKNTFTIKNSDIVLNNNSVYFSNNENIFYSIDVRNGIINWTQNINSNLRPTIIENAIFTITLEGYLVVMDSRNGNILRITNIFDHIKKSKRKKMIPIGFIVANNKIYLSLENGKLILIDLINGKTIDTIKISNSKISRPNVLGENMYLIKDDSIIKIN